MEPLTIELEHLSSMTPAIDNYATHQQEHLFEVAIPQRWITVAQRAVST